MRDKKRIKRKLTEQERKLCTKGISLRKSRIEDLTNDLDYNKAYKIFQEEWKQYIKNRARLKKQKEEQYLTKILETLKSELEMEKKALKGEQKMLRCGVEIKEKKIPIGVN